MKKLTSYLALSMFAITACSEIPRLPGLIPSSEGSSTSSHVESGNLQMGSIRVKFKWPEGGQTIAAIPSNTYQFVVSISGPGIAPAITETITRTDNITTKAIAVPVGTDRVVSIAAKDSAGTTLASGFKSGITITAGQYTPVNITLSVVQEAPKPRWSRVYASTVGITDLYFPNQNLFWITEGKNIKHSADGGASWVTQFAGTQDLNTINFVGNVGWAGGNNGTLLKTTDGGNSWRIINWSGAGTRTISMIRFNTSTEGVMTYDGSLYMTSDGGESWTSLGISSGNMSDFYNGRTLVNSYYSYQPAYLYESGGLTRVYSAALWYSSWPSSSEVWAMGNGNVVRSKDAGNTWSSITKLNLVTEIKTIGRGLPSFVSASEGVIFENESNYNNSHYVTSDGGLTWRVGTMQGIPSGATLYRIRLDSLTNGTGFIRASNQDCIYKLRLQ